MRRNTKLLIALAILLVIVAGFALVWHFCGPQNDVQSGAKDITVTVVHGDGSKKDFELKTDAEFLRGALDEGGFVKGNETEYGLFMTDVDGETADASKEQWWKVTKGDEMLMTGVDMTPIEDGDVFLIVLTTGYDV